MGVVRRKRRHRSRATWACGLRGIGFAAATIGTETGAGYQESKYGLRVLGAGAWANFAHIPGWQRDPRCEVVAICDPLEERGAQNLPGRFDIPLATADWQQVVGDPAMTCNRRVHAFGDAFYAGDGGAGAGKHVLCEKPVAYDYRETRRLAALARAKGLKTKLGFTFARPGVQYAKSLK